MTQRIDQTFAALKAANSTAFVAYMMGGDPDRETSQKLLNALPGAGVDIIELGMPFTDPAAMPSTDVRVVPAARLVLTARSLSICRPKKTESYALRLKPMIWR